MNKDKTRESLTKEIIDLFYKEGPLTNEDLDQLQKSTKELCAIPNLASNKNASKNPIKL